jgi:hypothetical protein
MPICPPGDPNGKFQSEPCDLGELTPAQQLAKDKFDAEQKAGPQLEVVGTDNTGLVVWQGPNGFFVRNPTTRQLVPASDRQFQEAQFNAQGGGATDGGSSASALGFARLAQEQANADRVFAREGEEIEKNDAEALVLREFYERQEARAVHSGDTTAEHNARTLIESIQARIDRNEIARETLTNNINQFNADMAFKVSQENERRRVENIRLQQENAIALSEAQQNPADIGKVVSLLTSRDVASAGLRAAAERGESGITEESLQPIQELIDTETELAGGPSEVTFNPTPIPEFVPQEPAPNLEELFTPFEPEPLTGAAREAQLREEFFRDFPDPDSGGLSLATGGTALITKPTTLNVAENGPELITGVPLGSGQSTLPEVDRGMFDAALRTGGAVRTTQGALQTAAGGPQTTRGTIQTATAGIQAAPQVATAATGGTFDFGVYGNLQGLINAVTAESKSGTLGAAGALIQKYTAFVSAGGTPSVGDSGGADAPGGGTAKERQDKLVADILAKLGLTDILQAFPIKASAPGTTKFQQRAFQGAFSAAGFGDEELFNQLLARNRPTAVQAGAARRSA